VFQWSAYGLRPADDDEKVGQGLALLRPRRPHSWRRVIFWGAVRAPIAFVRFKFDKWVDTVLMQKRMLG